MAKRDDIAVADFRKNANEWDPVRGAVLCAA
jgi:hypothetical protein